ncbi:MAG: hypothetical protein CM15mV13_3090 [uncultured marine virus]|nr:MAG: hypothetical protein CM15mV13_3090 [uncultured marine virus]
MVSLNYDGVRYAVYFCYHTYNNLGSPSNAPSTLHYWCHYHTGQGNQLNLSSTVGDPPSGFHWVSAGDEAMVTFGEDGCGGHPEASGQYHYHDADMLTCWKTNQVMAGYNDYYGSSQFGQDNMRHPDGHSKILGFAFDGYPVYDLTDMIILLIIHQQLFL